MGEGSGRGAYRGPRAVVGFAWCGLQNPAAGRLASEAAAFPQLCCCLSRGMVQCRCSLFPWRRDETREIRDRQQNPKAKRVETSCDFPTEEGKGCRRRHGICRLSLGVHTTVEYVCTVLLAGWETFQSSRVSNQERLGNQGKGTSERVSVTVAREWLP